MSQLLGSRQRSIWLWCKWLRCHCQLLFINIHEDNHTYCYAQKSCAQSALWRDSKGDYLRARQILSALAHVSLHQSHKPVDHLFTVGSHTKIFGGTTETKYIKTRGSVMRASYRIYETTHQGHSHTCQPIRLKILEILFFRTLRSHSSKPLPPTARILSYLSSAQQDLTGEPHENIRKPLIAISTLNSGT